MSYHILHLTSPNIKLYADKGILFCKFENGDTKMVSLQDIRAIIVAAFGVSFTNNCIAKLLENNVVILHCNMHYQPVGWSLPQERTVRSKLFFNQIAQNEDFENKLWKKILKTKVLNQAAVLNLMGDNEHTLFKLINRPLISEANIAKQYWQHYFTNLGTPQKREHSGAESFENGCLNYGYAVFNTLIYRSIIVHGLIAGLGIHHTSNYKNTPLVYDLLEPYRAFVDFYFYKFLKECAQGSIDKDFKHWSRYLANAMRNWRLEINGTSYKIVDSVEIYVEKIAAAFLKYDIENIFLPLLEQQYLHIDKHRNREYEE